MLDQSHCAQYVAHQVRCIDYTLGAELSTTTLGAGVGCLSHNMVNML